MGCDGYHAHARAFGRLDDGTFRPRELQAYPKPMCSAIAEAIFSESIAQLRDGTGAGGWRRPAGAAPRVSAWSLRARSPGDAAIALLDEATVRGRGVTSGDQQLAFHLHVHDGISTRAARQ